MIWLELRHRLLQSKERVRGSDQGSQERWEDDRRVGKGAGDLCVFRGRGVKQHVELVEY